MVVPLATHRQQQSWALSDMEFDGNARLVAHNNCGHYFPSYQSNNDNNRIQGYHNSPSISSATNIINNNTNFPGNPGAKQPSNLSNNFLINNNSLIQNYSHFTPQINRHQQYDFNNQQNKYAQLSSPSSKKNLNQKFSWPPVRLQSDLVSFKSKIGVEYRRYAVPKKDIIKFDDFFKKIQIMHRLPDTSFTIHYSDQDGDYLPLNNDDNLARAIDTATCLKTTQLFDGSNIPEAFFKDQTYSQQYYYKGYPQKFTTIRPLLKLLISRKGNQEDFSFTLNRKRKDNLMNKIRSINSSSSSRPSIGMPEDFRQVSSIIDADKLPITRRRVVIKRVCSDQPLGFYIRDGSIRRLNSRGIVERNEGIFISKVILGGLAESTNLLAVDDEILEVNGVEILRGKSVEQVRDMMIANSSNLILTTRPAKYVDSRPRPHPNRDRLASSQSNHSDLCEDFIRHHIN